MDKENKFPIGRMKNLLMLKCGLLAVLAGGVGFALALWEKKPLGTVSPEVLKQIATQSITDYSVSFYGGGILISVGCLLLTFAVLNLMVVIHNYQIKNKLIMSLLESIEMDYHPVLRAILLFFLYQTTLESFQYLGMRQALAFFSENESAQAWVILFYLLLKIVLYIMAVALVSEYAYHRIMNKQNCKGVNSLGKVFGVLLLVGIVANTFNNFWYLLFCAAAVALWEVFNRFLHKRTEIDIDEVTKLVENLDL